MQYIKHKNLNLHYGVLIDGNIFQQHRWVSLNKNSKDNIPRGDIGQFIQVVKNIERIEEFVLITKNEYEILFYNDYLRIT